MSKSTVVPMGVKPLIMTSNTANHSDHPIPLGGQPDTSNATDDVNILDCSDDEFQELLDNTFNPLERSSAPKPAKGSSFTGTMDRADDNDSSNDSDNVPPFVNGNGKTGGSASAQGGKPASPARLAPGMSTNLVSGHASHSASSKHIAKDEATDSDKFYDDDIDYEENDSPIETQFANIQDDLANLADKVDQEVADFPAKRKFMNLIDVLAKTAEDIDREKNIPRVPSENFSSARTRLEQTTTVLLHMKAKLPSNSKATTPSTGVDSKATDSADKEIAEVSRILAVMESNEEIFQKNHLPSQKNRDALQQQINETAQVLDEIRKETHSLKKGLADALTIEMVSNLKQLHELKSDIENYESPNSKVKIIEDKKLHVDAAIAIFKSMLKDVPPEIKGYKKNGFSGASHNKKQEAQFDVDARALLKYFQQRSKTLSDCIITGKKPIDTPALADWEDGSSELMKALRKNFGKFDDISTDETAHEKHWIPGIIDAFLEKYREADGRSGKRLLIDAKSHVLNTQRDWEVIEDEFLVPVNSITVGQITKKDDPSNIIISVTDNVKVKTTTTPVGHVFREMGKLIEGGWSAIKDNSVKDYQSVDPADPRKEITTGYNSHTTTESLHAVNVARTEIVVGDEVLFSGTRSGTPSAYQLYPKYLKKMSSYQLEQMAQQLMGQIPAPNSNPFDDSHLTALDEEWVEAMKKIQAINDADGSTKITEATISAFIEKAISSEKFCELLRRKVALNRTREIFLADVLGNPQLLGKIKNGQPIHFNSLSLLTPDRMRSLLAKLLPKKFSNHNELAMRKEEVQAWKDLQAEIDKNRCVIDGQVVKAKIHTFSIGVNQLSLGSGSKLSRALCSGWNNVEDENREAITSLIGDPAKLLEGTFGGQAGEAIAEQIKKYADAENRGDRNAAAEATDKVNQIKELASQIAAMWESGEYRRGEDQPYKLAARLALLSHLMDSGTCFSCKSGNGRTAQLDVEIKLLAVQMKHRLHEGPWLRTTEGMKAHRIPPPYKGRTEFDRYQLLAFIFKDRSRTEIQRYNTGVQGSKMNYWRELCESFIPANETHADWIGREFRGRSAAVSA